MDESTLAERIKAIRSAAGDSPAQAGKKVGVSRQAFVKLEQGDTENMKLGNLMRFCDRYMVNIEGLLRGEDAPLWNIGKTITKPVLVAREPSEKEPETSVLSEEEKRLLDGYKIASADTRKNLLAIVDVVLRDFSRRSEIN